MNEQVPSKDLSSQRLSELIATLRQWWDDATADNNWSHEDCTVADDTIAALRQLQSTLEPPAVTGEAVDAARAALKVDTNVTYPSHVAARQVRHVIRELVTAYERLHTLYTATCSTYCREHERASQPPPDVPNSRVQLIAEAAKRDDTNYRTNAQFYCRDLLLHIHGLIRESKTTAEPPALELRALLDLALGHIDMPALKTSYPQDHARLAPYVPGLGITKPAVCAHLPNQAAWCPKCSGSGEESAP